MAGIGKIGMTDRELLQRGKVTVTLNVWVRVRRTWRVWVGLYLMRMGARLAGLRYSENNAEVPIASISRRY